LKEKTLFDSFFDFILIFIFDYHELWFPIFMIFLFKNHFYFLTLWVCKDLILQLFWGLAFIISFLSQMIWFFVFALLFDLFFVVHIVTHYFLFFNPECCTNWIISVRAKYKFKHFCTIFYWQHRFHLLYWICWAAYKNRSFSII